MFKRLESTRLSWCSQGVLGLNASPAGSKLAIISPRSPKRSTAQYREMRCRLSRRGEVRGARGTQSSTRPQI